MDTDDTMTTPPVRIRVAGFDHLVVNVGDVEAALAFYTDVLGMEPVRVEEWRAGQVPFPSVRIDATTIIDLFAAERTGQNVDHLCLVVDGDIDAIAASGALEVEAGPMDLFGAQGTGRGIYVRDPDGNRIELRSYG